MDTNFQPITSNNARSHYRQNSLEFKRALVALAYGTAAYSAAVFQYTA